MKGFLKAISADGDLRSDGQQLDGRVSQQPIQPREGIQFQRDALSFR